MVWGIPIMKLFRIVLVFFVFISLSNPAITDDNKVTISGGTALIYGDFDSVSDPSLSIHASYERFLKPRYSIGIEGGIDQAEGKPINIINLYPYKTTIIPGGFFLKYYIPGFSVFRPYLKGGGGLAYVMPKDKKAPGLKPAVEKVNNFLNVYAGMGGGVLVVINTQWALEFGLQGSYYFTDKIDNIDGEYYAGEKNANDLSLRGSIGLVYRFGKKTVTAPSEPIYEVEVKKKEPVSGVDSDGDGIPDPDNDKDDVDDQSSTIPKMETDKDAELPYTIHVSSYLNLSGAYQEIETYKQRGFEAFIVLNDDPSLGKMYRIYLGHFGTESEAARVAQTLINRGYTKYTKVVLTQNTGVTE